MTKRQKFIEAVDEALKMINLGENEEDVISYWEAFKGKEEKEKPQFTDNGKLILKYMQEHINDMPMGKAKDIGEGLFISSRAVSGAIRKLVTDGFVEKVSTGDGPVLYSITEKGKEIKIEN